MLIAGYGKVVTMAEIWDLYEYRGEKTGEIMKRGDEIPRGRYHIGVHIWPINSRREFLIQRRSMTVQWKPGLWAVTGGSAISGETPLEAAHRELQEELGYNAKPGELQRIVCLRRTNSFCSVFAVRMDWHIDDFVLQKEEVEAVQWCSEEKLKQMIRDGTMYNYGDAYYRTLFEYSGTSI